MNVPRRTGLVLLGVTIVLGLLSRLFPLPGVLAEHTGDALYAVAATWIWALLLPRTSPMVSAALAFGSSATVEFAQLLRWPWLVELRGTRVGALPTSGVADLPASTTLRGLRGCD